MNLPREFSAPVFWCKPYVSYRSTQVLDPLSHIIRCLKEGKVTVREINHVVKVLTGFIEGHEELKSANAIVAMPRKIPDKPSDMQVIATGVAVHFGIVAPDNFLVRTKEPARGKVVEHRIRCSAEDHASSFKVVGDNVCDHVILLDNVLTTGGTMEGAIRAVQRDTEAKVSGLVVLYSDVS
jgi:hypothetical protein